jgi:uncharacterized protein YbbC (DUF1343 family)
MHSSIRLTFASFVVLLMVSGVAPVSAQVVPGLEVLLQEQKSLIEGRRVGLVANHTSVDRRLRHAADLLAKAPGVKLTAIFAPEHGFRGMAQAGDDIANAIDDRTGVPVHSLYGATMRPTPEMLKDVDVLLFDIQDVGVRFYTYISTMGECMAAAAEQGIPFIVLDRPNPLPDVMLQGRMIDLARFRSFVGSYAVPIRYGWTIGELAGFVRDGLQESLKKDVKLTVVKMKNYRRTMWYDETGLAWISPSPNIPTLTTATVYPGMCLFEGTNLSEGRGTMLPFESIGAPWLDPYKVIEQLSALQLEGVLFRPVFFNPTSSKHQGVVCRGIQVHVTDRGRFDSVKVALHMLAIIKRNHPNEFGWRDSHMDRLTGSDEVRLAMDQGKSPDEIIASWRPEVAAFDAMRQEYILYR